MLRQTCEYCEAEAVKTCGMCMVGLCHRHSVLICDDCGKSFCGYDPGPNCWNKHGCGPVGRWKVRTNQGWRTMDSELQGILDDAWCRGDMSCTVFAQAVQYWYEYDMWRLLQTNLETGVVRDIRWEPLSR